MHRFEIEGKALSNCIMVFVGQPGTRVRLDIPTWIKRSVPKVRFYSAHAPYGNWSVDMQVYPSHTVDSFVVSDTSLLRLAILDVRDGFRLNVSQFRAIGKQ